MTEEAAQLFVELSARTDGVALSVQTQSHVLCVTERIQYLQCVFTYTHVMARNLLRILPIHENAVYPLLYAENMVATFVEVFTHEISGNTYCTPFTLFFYSIHRAKLEPNKFDKLYNGRNLNSRHTFKMIGKCTVSHLPDNR